MKQIIIVASMYILSSLLMGCGKQVIEENIAISEEANVEASVESSAEINEEISEEQVITIQDISSVELVSNMKIGWSLGNTLDATGGTGNQSEISWGNPVTKKEMIDAIVAQGFNVIRIPVTWANHMGSAPEYKIHEQWLERVKEVVDYAYENEVYVILNLHHEDWMYPSEEMQVENSQRIEAMWTQIANYFIEYDEHLIFEGLNEPRKIGTNMEWNGGDKEGRDVVNSYAKSFINAVRNTGGNNTLRHLMIPGYAASSVEAALKAIEIPEDGKVIISVHAYTPYNFALNINGTSDWNQDTREIDSLMNTLDTLFIQEGIPVIIGEFGAMNKDNEAQRAQWGSYYVTKAKEKGIPCVWWDNGAFSGSGELFGLLDRRKIEYPYPDLLEALIEASK